MTRSRHAPQKWLIESGKTFGLPLPSRRSLPLPKSLPPIEDKYAMDCSIIAPYFLRPSLCGLYGHKIGSNDDDYHLALAALESGASSLTHLDLQYCMIN